MFEADDDALRRRRIAALGDRSQGHQHVRFGEIGGGRSASQRIRDDSEALRSSITVAPLAHQIDGSAIDKPEFGQIVGMDEHDAPIIPVRVRRTTRAGLGLSDRIGCERRGPPLVRVPASPAAVDDGVELPS